MSRTFNFDGGKKARMTRKSITMKNEPKDRSKARPPKQRPGFKKRRSK